MWGTNVIHVQHIKHYRPKIRIKQSKWSVSLDDYTVVDIIEAHYPRAREV